MSENKNRAKIFTADSKDRLSFGTDGLLSSSFRFCGAGGKKVSSSGSFLFFATFSKFSDTSLEEPSFFRGLFCENSSDHEAALLSVFFISWDRRTLLRQGDA